MHLIVNNLCSYLSENVYSTYLMLFNVSFETYRVKNERDTLKGVIANLSYTYVYTCIYNKITRVKTPFLKETKEADAEYSAMYRTFCYCGTYWGR